MTKQQRESERERKGWGSIEEGCQGDGQEKEGQKQAKSQAKGKDINYHGLWQESIMLSILASKYACLEGRT